MTLYIEPPVVTDPDQLAQDAYDYLQTQMPGWVPNAGNLDTWIIEANAMIAAEIATVASNVPALLFEYFGGLVGVTPIAAAAASVGSTWAMRDNAGYTIPAGTLVGIPGPGGATVPFAVAADVVVAPGSTTTGEAAVTLVALTPGAAGNGLGADELVVQLITTLDYVTTIDLTGSTSGGVDAEADVDYRNRLATELQLLSPRPILPADFAAIAQNIAGVERALAIDGYNPGDHTTGNERMVAIAAVDANGAAVSGTIKTAIQTELEAKREVNFVVNTFDPTYTEIDVNFTVAVAAGYDPTATVAACTAALDAYLSPANWGLAPSGDQRTWLPVTSVNYLQVATVLNNVQGVDHVTALTIGVHGGAMGTVDVALAAQAGLPQVGTITGAHT